MKVDLKRRFANWTNKEEIEKMQEKIVRFQNLDFSGEVFFRHFVKVKKKKILPNQICLIDNNYKWLQFYDKNSKVCLTTIYDEKNRIVEWYFDIAKKIGKENGMLYEDDLYLDVVVQPNGETILLDEDDLQEALEKQEISKEEFEQAYEIAKDLLNKLKGKKRQLREFTYKYLKMMLEVGEQNEN